jgi:ABC-type molybdenum transport system ATPase subunit/photorepair protein PhrA
MYFFMDDKELLLLDEPFQFLYNDTKEQVNHYLSAHLHRDITMVLITHYEADIEKWTHQRLAL